MRTEPRLSNANRFIRAERRCSPLPCLLCEHRRGQKLDDPHHQQLSNTGAIRMSDDGFLDANNVASGGNFARLSNSDNWGAVSDARLKTDVTPSQGQLAAAMKLCPVDFRWKEFG